MTRATLAPAIQRGVSEHSNMEIHVTESYSPILIRRSWRLSWISQWYPRPWAPWFEGSAFSAHLGNAGGKPGQRCTMRPMRLRDVGPLNIVLPSHANARRNPLETYFTTNGVEIERIVEMDADDGHARPRVQSDWVTTIPALMMTAEIERMRFSVVPLLEPTAPLDLVVIEPMRRTLSDAARAFLEFFVQRRWASTNLWRQYFESSKYRW